MVPQLAGANLVDGAEPFRVVGVADDRDKRDADGHDQSGDQAAHGDIMAHVNARPSANRVLDPVSRLVKH
jgi:hypothetical protein